MKIYFKYLLFSAGWGAVSCFFYINDSRDILFSEILLKFGFSEFYLHSTGLRVLLQWYLPILLFQVLFGTYIYRHFCSASVYYFSRCERRIRWFIREALMLYPFAVVHLLIMITAGTLVTGLTNAVRFDEASFWVFLYFLMIHSLWLYLSTLLINIFAIKLRSGGAFILISGIQVFFVVLFGYWGDNPKFEEFPISEQYVRILKINPLSHLIIKWHSSGIEAVNERIHTLGADFDLNQSVILFLFLSILAVAVGCGIVKKQEFIVINIETGGV